MIWVSGLCLLLAWSRRYFIVEYHLRHCSVHGLSVETSTIGQCSNANISSCPAESVGKWNYISPLSTGRSISCTYRSSVGHVVWCMRVTYVDHARSLHNVVFIKIGNIKMSFWKLVYISHAAGKSTHQTVQAGYRYRIAKLHSLRFAFFPFVVCLCSSNRYKRSIKPCISTTFSPIH